MAKRPIKRSAKRGLAKFGATTKRAKRVRTEAEFPLVRLAPEMRFPLRMLGDFIWDDDAIRGARDAQQRGYFWAPAKLSQSIASDAGLFTSRLNRLAPMRGLPVELKPADTTVRSARVLDEAQGLFGSQGIAMGRDTLVTLHKQFVDHGVFFAYNRWNVRPDGSRVDVELLAWPIEFVRWMPQSRSFYTLTKQGQLMKIDHGDGRWVVGQSEKIDPWANGCIVPAGRIWADRSFAIRDRSNASRSHGQAKMIGTMPEGLSIFGKANDGSLVITPEAQAMLDLLLAMHVGDLPYGLKPFGADIDMKVNQSQAWQIWENMIKTDDQDAARVYLGQDGTTSNAGGDYVKSERLFGVRNDLVEADLGSFTEAISTGTIQPWAAINFGDSRCAPLRLWLMPDADEDARRVSIGNHLDAFFKAIANLRAQGFVVTQVTVSALCKTFGVGPFTLADVAAANAGTVTSRDAPASSPTSTDTAPSSQPAANESEPPDSASSLADAAQ